MTAARIYRLACDAPRCDVHTVIEKLSDTPDGWTRVDSRDHLADWKPGQYVIPGRRVRDKRTAWDIHAGGFTVHLCPDHADVFDGHRPSTEGRVADRRSGDRDVTVRCSCGQFGQRVRDLILVRSADDVAPAHTPERAWWRHLPAELREYATRGRVNA